MALAAGTLSVNGDGDVSGSGLALALYDACMAAVPEDKRQSVAPSVAPFFQAFATALVTYLTTNAEVTVTVSQGGLQRTPNPNNPNTPTVAPAAPVELAGTIE